MALIFLLKLYKIGKNELTLDLINFNIKNLVVSEKSSTFALVIKKQRNINQLKLYNMEKIGIIYGKNPSIIYGKRIDLAPYFGKLDEDSHVISWKALGYMVKPVKDNLIIGEEYEKYSVLPKCKEYAARFPKSPLYTNEEGLQFVSLVLSKSNFAKAGKVLFVLYRKVEKEYKPCGVVTEEF